MYFSETVESMKEIIMYRLCPLRKSKARIHSSVCRKKGCRLCDPPKLLPPIAAKLQEALRRGRPVFMEPIMDLECSVPEEFMGTVIGDLNTRRAKIVNLGTRGKMKTARCEVPLAEMFNYANALRSLTQGRASFSMEPASYAEVPHHVAEKIKGAKEVLAKK